jgi:hypothetical protein
MSKVVLQLGQVTMTSSVGSFLKDKNIDPNELGLLIYRHQHCDWGNILEEDAKMNTKALTNEERIMSSYIFHGRQIWAITEADRSVTTALFPEDY